ncbi:PEP-CTERM sorting domain-containing protein [Nostoc sp. MG11]|uniref:PEP-CTERM sorting domain-containing protein n=1 Tax=Nostoc sp. MG11 TaxID=2721166 RepID=UPI00186877BC|nr:PEP-CTERM sorting domain-containing protein [Nostoc sp. MG11]
MKLISRLAIATASFGLIFTNFGEKSASAAIVYYDFTVDSPITKGNGSFSFDDATFSNDNIPVAPIKSLNFQFDGQSGVYTERDDLEYPTYPLVFPTTFLTGTKSVGLQYKFLDKANSAIDYEVNGYDFTITANNQISLGKVSYKIVPEPITLGGSLMAGGIGWLMKRKRKSVKKLEA